MKIFSVFMMMIALLAGFNLCPDDTCSDTESTQLTNTIEDEARPEEPCSLFCICSGCSGSVLIPGLSSLYAGVSFASEKMKDLPVPLSDMINGLIWQPPKFA